MFDNKDAKTGCYHDVFHSFQLLCATVFIFPAWYLTSQPLEMYRMGLAWVICVLTTILAQTFGLVFGAACGVKVKKIRTMYTFSHRIRTFKQTPIYTCVNIHCKIYFHVKVFINIKNYILTFELHNNSIKLTWSNVTIKI